MTRSRRVARWLREYLSNGPTRERQVLRAATTEGYSAEQVQEAAECLGVMCRYAGGWEPWWRLPGDTRLKAKQPRPTTTPPRLS